MRRSAGLLVLVAVAAGGCGGHRDTRPRADRAWVRLAPLPDRPSAAYLTLHGGDAPVRVVAVTSPAVRRIELHGMAMEAVPGTGLSMSAMRPLAGIDVPAHGEVALSPGGMHAMLFGLPPAPRPGDRVPLAVRLAQGGALPVEAQVVAAGDPAPF